jgi:HEAT repeat protein/3',5'-cyclic AMP phosphodiesterase CpdA
MTSGEEKTELQVAIPKQKAEAVLTQFLAGKVAHPEDCALCWLEDLRKHHLIQRGAGDQIEFRHQLIQEYYTAECLLKLLPSLSEDELKREYLNYLKWTEPLALMLELVEDEAQAVRVVKLALEVDLRLGARLAGAVKPEWQEQTVGLVTGLEIPQLLKIQLLSLTQSEKIIPELVKALNHEGSDVRWMAVEALGDVNSSAAILALVKALDDKDYFVHRDAVEALVNLCSKTQEERLDDYINSIRKFRQIEPYYLHPLGFQCYHGSNAALEGLVNDLNHEDSSVRRDAAHTLGRIGSQVSAEMFSSGSYLVIGGFVNAAVIEELFGALNHEDCYVRWSTADALVNIGLQLTIKVQFEIFDYEDYCVFDFGSTGVIEELVGALNHEDCYVRWSAIKWLVNVLTDENYHARGKAAKALRKIGLELAIPGLVNALEHEDSSVRGKAAKALRKIGLESAIPGLVNALKHEDSSVRGKAAKALEEIASPEVLPDLSECLKTDKTTKLLNTISAIQEHCKFYNYTLTHPSSPPVSGKSKPKNSSTKPKSISLMHILHLSDLHFGTLDQANLWSNQLTEDLQNDRNISHLDALILSGDIANYSTETEYNAAKEFINELAREFQIRRSHIIIVPGNHDLNWELGDKAFSYDENGLPKRDMTQHQRRFDYFRNFYQAIKGEAYPLEYEHQGIVYHLPKQKLLILGLNSAWKLDRFQKTDANINDQALTNALKKIRDNQDLYEGCVKIAVWHHPLNSSGEDRIKDQGFMERLAQNGFRLALHGHVHTAKKDLFNYDYTSNTSDRKLDIICAGTFGAPTKELVTGYPWQYNLLKIADNNLTVYTRRREELNGAWKPDARWLQGAGQEPLSYYAIEL